MRFADKSMLANGDKGVIIAIMRSIACGTGGEEAQFEDSNKAASAMESKKPVVTHADHGSSLCADHPAGESAADLACRFPKWRSLRLFPGPVYCDFGNLCDRTGGV